MGHYIIIHRHNRGNDWKMEEGEANSLREFLDGINGDILAAREFVVYTVLEGFTKEELLEGGDYDNVIPEEV